MPKPEPIDYFLLKIKVPIPMLGEATASLARIGLNVVETTLMTDIPTFAQKTQHEVKAEEYLAAWIADHPTFKAKEAVKYFRDDGRTDGACYTALRVLCEKKILKKLEAGNYARADMKALAAPKKVERERHDVDHREFILRYGRQHHGRMSAAKLRAHFDLHDRKPSSVGGALNVLLKQKMIKALGDGEYELRVKATPERKAKPPFHENAPPPTPKSNGIAAHVEEVTHG